MADEKYLDAIAQAGLAADLLSIGRSIDLWNSGLSMLVFAVLLLSAGDSVGLIASLMLGVVSKGYALRVRLDEAVFRRWSNHWSLLQPSVPEEVMAAFDRSLGRSANSRSLEDRCRGARRLLGWQIIYSMGQTLCVLAVALTKA
jgi:hypothetical protein